jgi:hypothetical protein
VLLWDGTGLCLYQKRLEYGRFASLWQRDEQEVCELTPRSVPKLSRPSKRPSDSSSSGSHPIVPVVGQRHSYLSRHIDPRSARS